VADTGGGRTFAGLLDGSVVIVKANKFRVRKRLRHQNGRGSQAAADIGDAGSGLKFFLHAIEGGDPTAHQICDITGAEEQLGSAKQVGVVFVPAEAVAGLEAVDHFGHGSQGRRGQHKGTGQVGRIVFV